MIGAVNPGTKAAPSCSGIWLFPFGLYDSSSFFIDIHTDGLK